MARKIKATRRVRLRLDLVVELDRDVTSLPFGPSEYAAPMLLTLARMLEEKGVVALCSPFSVQFAVDHRKIKGVDARTPLGEAPNLTGECRRYVDVGPHERITVEGQVTAKEG
jgi:hypothetical protein